MLKFIVAFMLMFAAPGIALAKAPVTCAKGDKACEKKKAKAAKKAGKDKKASKAKDKKKDKKKTAAKKADKKKGKKTIAHKGSKKKKSAAQMAPPTDLSEPTPMNDDSKAYTPALETIETPAPAETSTAAGDLEGDTFPDPSRSGASSDSSGSPDGIGSDSDFDLGDELPAE